MREVCNSGEPCTSTLTTDLAPAANGWGFSIGASMLYFKVRTPR